jgi:hypothetical protein
MLAETMARNETFLGYRRRLASGGHVLDYFPESRSFYSLFRMPGFIVVRIEPAYRVGGWRIASGLRDTESDG